MTSTADRSASIAELARGAETALDRTLRAPSEEATAEIAEGVRRLVRLRDELIARRRAREPEPAGWLGRTNAILSCVVGAEFPIQGLHRERIEMALRGLRDMIAREPRAAAG
jgi:hypothetical protein